MSDPVWRCFDSASELDNALAETVSDRLRQGLELRGCAGLAVSGGRTPAGFFAALSQTALDWSQVCVTLVDERWVNTQHCDSNERLLRRQLLQGNARTCRIVGLKTEHTLPEEGEDRCRQHLQALPWPLDIVHLGMGEDGHTASWFPDAPEYPQATDSGNTRLAMAIHPASTPQARMTFTLHSVLNCHQLLVQITGDSKRRLLESVLAGEAPPLPIRHVVQQDQTPVTIFWAPS